MQQQLERYQHYVENVLTDPALIEQNKALANQLAEHDFKFIGDIPEEVYHTSLGISRSGLVDAQKNLNKFRFKHLDTNTTETTLAMALGDMVHKAILEPHLLHSKYCSDAEIMADLSKYASPRATKVYKEYRTKKEEEGLYLMPYDKYDEMKIMVEKIWNHPRASALLRDGMAEKSLYAKDPKTGLVCRVRPDYFLQDGILVDVKTCLDASEEEFSKKCASMSYYLQAGFYTMVAEWLTGRKFQNFIFVCIEKEAPYDVALWRADPAMLEVGQLEAERQLIRVAECFEKGFFPSFSPKIENIGLPHWFLQNFSI